MPKTINASPALLLERELAELSGWHDLHLAPPDEGDSWYGTYVDPKDGQVYTASHVPSWARRDADAFDLMVEARCYPRDITLANRAFVITNAVDEHGDWIGKPVAEPIDAHPDRRAAVRTAIVRAAILLRQATAKG